jgi:group II intron reverse transcriptase/maturase
MNRERETMFEHSRVEDKTWSTKLSRIGALSASDEKVVFNNLGHMLSAEALKELYSHEPGDRAVGIDGVTKESYGVNLDANLANLITRIRRGTYKPQPARLVEIPKEDGNTRPLAISCFEDKLVQRAVNEILVRIYEPLFLDCSFGFRPGRSQHAALKRLMNSCNKVQTGAVVEIDLRRCFNTIPHAPLHEFLTRKISDSRFLRLINILLKTPTATETGIVANDTGCPQGSILSPVLSNIFLHHVLDEWFTAINASHLGGHGDAIRFADDAIYVFRTKKAAERFAKVLPKRLEKYGLELNEAKSGVITTGQTAALQAATAGDKLPTFKFLGFTCYWGLARSGKFYRLKFTSRSDRMRTKLRGMRQYLRANLNHPDTTVVLDTVRRVVTGWLNYHAVTDNIRKLQAFLHITKRNLLWWFHRRSQRSKMTWDRLIQLLAERRYPTCRITVPLF